MHGVAIKQRRRDLGPRSSPCISYKQLSLSPNAAARRILSVGYNLCMLCTVSLSHIGLRFLQNRLFIISLSHNAILVVRLMPLYV